MKIFTVANLPDELSEAWLQHLRNFDAANPGCHFQVVADAPDLSMAQIVEQLRRLKPGLTITEIFERPAVHILNYGLPLCRFTFKLPAEWPPGNKWVGLDDAADATCEKCRALAVDFLPVSACPS